jgi:hypothetical protein
MTDQHLKHASDPNQLAKSTIDRVTGQQPSPVDTRDPAAVAPHKDGLEKDLAHATTLTPERCAVGKKNPPA